MKKTWASIDIGTHTARLLIAHDLGPSGILRPLARRRAYIRLAEDFDYSGKRIIQSDAIDRTLNALQDFSHHIKTLGAHSVRAVATGVVREATNREEFLGRIYEHTGIRVRHITGDEEALLTAKGMFHALGPQTSPFLLFDLGGGSTEFVLGTKGASAVRSIPLGAAVLTKTYLRSDPPKKTQVDSLSRYIEQCLKKANLEFTEGRNQCFVAGTGGTVTALASMLHGFSSEEIIAERINGLTLKRHQLEAFVGEMTNMSLAERLQLSGLDRGRAEVILAGSLVVVKILHFLRTLQMTVSMSDLLEGILIDCFEGESNG